MIRRRRSHGPQGLSRRRVLVLSLGTLVVAAAFLWAGLNAPNSVPGREYHTVTAQFQDAAGLTAHTQVRVAGRLVGQVLDPRIEDGRATAELQLEADLEPLRADARLRVRPRSAVGTPYVELFPGSAREPLGENEVIPAQRTSAAEPVDAVLSALDRPTRGRAQRLLRELGTSAAGRGEDLNATLAPAPAMVRDLGRAMQPLAADPQSVPRLLTAGAQVVRALEPQRFAAAEGWGPGSRVLAALDQRAALQAALDAAPRALRTARTGLAQTDPLLRAAERFARRAQPVLRDAPGALRSTDRMIGSANRHVEDLRRTLRLGRAATDPALRLLRATRDVLPRVSTATAALRPVVLELAPRRCDMLLLTDNWSSMLSNGANGQNVLRLAVTTAGFNSISGFVDPKATLPGTARNPYPAPCQTPKDAVALP
ncbi:MlaD family protein [Conexibacter sp. SYSU D00693]|uniref:MlaD family protein n=1 Tax=Conexibacter sp. SYSU D00693 TaxID=2812560 RepID=UPI00196AF989|nr:MlaD family protein [Conexibacter sp. SYSU D00693]